MANFVFALAIVGIYFIVFRYPGVACGLVFASYALEQYAQATVPLAASISPLCNYLMAGAVVVALTSQVIRHGPVVFRVHPPGALVLLLLAYCYATLLWSLFPSTTEQLLRTNVPYLLVFVGLAPMIIQGVKDVKYAILGLISGGTLSLLGLLFFGQWQGRSVILLNGSLSNPLALTQAAGSLLIAASLTDVIRKFFPRAWLLVGGTIGLVVLLTFLRSGSRGQIISAISVTLLISSMKKGGWWIPLLTLAVVAILALGFLEDELQQNAFRWDFDRLDHDVGEARAGPAIELLKIWSNSSPWRIWLGLGNGAAQDHRVLGHYPHVVPAEVLAEEGVIGFSIYCVAILVSIVAYTKARRSRGDEVGRLVLATAGLCGYEFLLTLKQGTLFGGIGFLLLLVLSGPLTRGQLSR